MKVDRDEQHEARRERIARAAFELFARSGLEQTSARDIARAAFVSRTNLYRYFPSKTHMLLAHFERSVAETRDEALRRLNTGANPQAVWGLVTGRMADLGVRYAHLVGAVGQAVMGLPTHSGAARGREKGRAASGQPGLPDMSNHEERVKTALSLVALVEPVLGAMRRQGHLRPDADTRLLAALFVDACILALLHGDYRNKREVLSDWQDRFALLMHGALAPGRTLQEFLPSRAPDSCAEAPAEDQRPPEAPQD